LQVLAGFDPQEPASVERPVPEYARALKQLVTAVRVGVPPEFVAGLEPEIQSAFDTALTVLKTFTAGVQQVPVPVNSDDRTTIRAAEAFAYHAARIRSTPDLYQPEVLARIRSGADISATDYIEARRRMDRLRREGHSAFQAVDVLAMPTVPVLPTPI